MLYYQKNSNKHDNLKEANDIEYLIPKVNYDLKFNNLKGGGIIIIQIGYKSIPLLKKSYSVIIFEKRGDNLIQRQLSGKNTLKIIDHNGRLINGFDTFSDLKKELKKYLNENLTNYKNETPF